MTLVISPKLRPDLKKLMELRNSYAEKATEEFLSEKKSQGIIISEKELLSDPKVALEYQRYLSGYISLKRNALIPKDITLERVDADGVPAEWIICPNAEKEKVLFHLFGGGYVMGRIETRRWLPFLMGRASKIHSLLIEYRLAPEHPFPAALEDSITAYRWLLSTGISSQKIILTGASAGGALVVSTLLRLRELNLPLPAIAVLLSPWTDLACTGESLESNAEYEPGITIPLLQGMAKLYHRDQSSKNPLVSPLYANLEKLPPMLIHAGNIETLRDDSVRLADRAKTAGIDVILKIWEDMPHVFQNYYNDLPESNQSIENIGRFIQKVLREK